MHENTQIMRCLRFDFKARTAVRSNSAGELYETTAPRVIFTSSTKQNSTGKKTTSFGNKPHEALGSPRAALEKQSQDHFAQQLSENICESATDV